MKTSLKKTEKTRTKRTEFQALFPSVDDFHGDDVVDYTNIS